jgi:hypothetical protein
MPIGAANLLILLRPALPILDAYSQSVGPK